jgi:hypothetical protein
MTKEKLEKAKELTYKIEKYKVYLRTIRTYEKGKYFGRDLKISLLRFQPMDYDAIYDDLFICDVNLKKDILNTIKIYYVALIQKLEQELEAI